MSAGGPPSAQGLASSTRWGEKRTAFAALTPSVPPPNDGQRSVTYVSERLLPLTPVHTPFLRGGDNTRLRLGQKGVAGKHLILGRERYTLARQRAVE